MTGSSFNDVHSRLNETKVREVVAPSGAQEVRDVLRRARRLHGRVSIAGGRHAMGGQQFLDGGTLIDTRNMMQILSLDSQTRFAGS